jgi:hypothetical protein
MFDLKNRKSFYLFFFHSELIPSKLFDQQNRKSFDMFFFSVEDDSLKYSESGFCLGLYVLRPLGLVIMRCAVAHNIFNKIHNMEKNNPQHGTQDGPQHVGSNQDFRGHCVPLAFSALSPAVASLVADGRVYA